ncbi:MAG: hypothetical protein WD876_01505 [Candidatus Pacearchaeota archaeon]
MPLKTKYNEQNPRDIRSGNVWEIFYHISLKTESGYITPTFGHPIFSPEEALNKARKFLKKGYNPEIKKTIIEKAPAFNMRKVFHDTLNISKLEKALEKEKLAKPR